MTQWPIFAASCSSGKTLALPVAWHQIDAMDPLQRAIKQAVDLAPGSARALARQAGIDQSILIRMISGERPISLEQAANIEAALRAWQRRCAQAADLIRTASRRREKP